jgi:hypothetical protein
LENDRIWLEETADVTRTEQQPMYIYRVRAPMGQRLERTNCSRANVPLTGSVGGISHALRNTPKKNICRDRRNK